MDATKPPPPDDPSPADPPPDVAPPGPRGYADTPWPAEDGGPRRPQLVRGLPGPDAGSARLAAVRQVPLAVMVLLGPDDTVYLLRNSIGPDAVSWVERLHPESLEVLDRSPDLALGPFWPGGAAVLDDGSIAVVQGRWAHRLGPDLGPLATRSLPVDAPHNSFVLLGDGSLATKDLQRPGGPPSTLSVLDPATLEDRAAPVALPEPSVARLGADGDDLVVVGVSTTSRHRWDPSERTIEHRSGHDATYLVHPDQSFSWDPVVADGATWWLDNGDHTYDRGLTMVGNGVADGPVRLWRADDDGDLRSVEVGGGRGGAVTNPPLVDPARGLVLGYDSANAVLAAFDTATLELRWRRDLATAQHLVAYPDTGEVLADDHRSDTGDALVVIDIGSGATRARVDVESPAQSVVFGAPGRRRDAYYVSLSTVARVEFGD